MIEKVPSYKNPSNNTPFSTYEWVVAWHETIGKEWELQIFKIGPITAPLATRKNELILAGGYEVADYLDLIGPEEDKPEAWTQIKKQFDGFKLVLRNIPETSATIHFFPMEQEDTTPITILPPELDKKDRHEMERKVRKFEREHVDVAFQDGDIGTLLALMKLDPKKKEFLTPDMESFFKKIAPMGTITVVTVQQTPVAAMLTFSNNDTLMGYNSGFDDGKYSGAGFYLKAKMLELARAKGFRKFNFLQGNERYKYELGGRDFFVYQTSLRLAK